VYTQLSEEADCTRHRAASHWLGRFHLPLKNSSTGKEWLGIPPHPQVSNPVVDFVLVNRDLLGHRMKKPLGRLKLSAQSQFKKEEASKLRALWVS